MNNNSLRLKCAEGMPLLRTSDFANGDIFFVEISNTLDDAVSKSAKPAA